MSELKMGDIVKCRSDGEWGDRIFIKYGRDCSVIVVYESTEIMFKDGESFSTSRYQSYDWQEKEKPQYRPFTWEERDMLRGKWVKHKTKKGEYAVVGTFEGLALIGAFQVFYRELLEQYEFTDGSPCGIEI